MASYTPPTYFQGIIYNPSLMKRASKEIQEIQVPLDLKVFKVFKEQRDILDQQEFKDPRGIKEPSFQVEVNLPTPSIGIVTRVLMK